jgi:hypothetical protein
LSRNSMILTSKIILIMSQPDPLHLFGLKNGI